MSQQTPTPLDRIKGQIKYYDDGIAAQIDRARNYHGIADATSIFEIEREIRHTRARLESLQHTAEMITKQQIKRDELAAVLGLFEKEGN